MKLNLDSSFLGALRCFEMAGRHSSFTKAAAALNLTQSAISQQIRNLEDKLGYPLFKRQGRGLVLTEKGLQLYETTSNVFAEISHTVHRLSLSGTPLKVNCLPSVALQWLMPRLVEFHRDQPDISVRLQAEFQSLDRHLMIENDIDVAIRYYPDSHQQASEEVILDEYLVAVATPDYVAAHPSLATGALTDDLTFLHDAEPWVGAPEYIEWRAWAAACFPDWVERGAGPQFNLSSLAISAGLNHQGIVMTRTILIQEELRSGRLVKAFEQTVRAPGRYVLLCQEPNEPRTAAFSTWLKDECRRFELARSDMLAAR
ncbi:LysR substrate-binding domain-containing protein [Burkholderia stagnalis]|uniref:LysR substrate-binding domain-containing protein n=1 Tax=Burkholderia stagnalis TaxID=1503054 RepID=UPI000F801F80|nr:LysR family transcriptional regulator [Burkholderia stagnalis]